MKSGSIFNKNFLTSPTDVVEEICKMINEGIFSQFKKKVWKIEEFAPAFWNLTKTC